MCKSREIYLAVLTLWSVLFGGIFYLIQEGIQPFAVKWFYGETLYHGTKLYDFSQPVLSLCAGLSCFLYFRFFRIKTSLIKSVFSMYYLSFFCFFFYCLWMGLYCLGFCPYTNVYAASVGTSLNIEICMAAGRLLMEISIWAIFSVILLFIFSRFVIEYKG